MPFGLLLKKKPCEDEVDAAAMRTAGDRQTTSDDELHVHVAALPIPGIDDDVPLGGSSAQHDHDGSPEALLDDWLQVDDDDDDDDNNDGSSAEGQESQESRQHQQDNLGDPDVDDMAWLGQVDEEEQTGSTDEETGMTGSSSSSGDDDRHMPSSPSWRSETGSHKGELTDEERETLKSNLLSINADNRLFVLRVQESLSRLSPEERLSMISVMRDQAEHEKEKAEAAANRKGRCHCLCNCIVIRVMRRITSKACLAKLMSLIGLGIGAFYILAGETAQEVQNKVIGWFQSIGKEPPVITAMPSLSPSMMASPSPSWDPTFMPSLAPSSMPSAMNTSMPSLMPSVIPSFAPTTRAPTTSPVSNAPISLPPTLAPVSMSPTMAPITEMPTSLPATANNGGGNKKKKDKGNKKTKTGELLNTNDVKSSTVEDENNDGSSSNIFDPTQSVQPQNEDIGFNRSRRRLRKRRGRYQR